jgi:hypothetical protein
MGTTPARTPTTWSPQQTERGLLLIFIGLLGVALLAPALAQPEHYHRFADARSLWAIPHAADVLSNLAFLGVGAWGLWRLGCVSPNAIAHAPVQHGAVLVLALGLCLTAAGSAVFHWQPNAAGLALDRMAMGVVFAGVLGLAVSQRVSERMALLTMTLVLTTAPLAAATAWHTGNATPWGVMQFGGMALLLGLNVGRTSAQARPWWALLLGYTLAKGLEGADAAIWQLTHGWVSGHPLKHGVAALAVMPLWQTLVYRNPA